MKKVIATTNAPAAIGPYSQAVQVGNMLFASGQLRGKRIFHDGSQRGIRQYKTAGASSLKLVGKQTECVGIPFEVSKVIPFLC